MTMNPDDWSQAGPEHHALVRAIENSGAAQYFTDGVDDIHYVAASILRGLDNTRTFLVLDPEERRKRRA